MKGGQQQHYDLFGNMLSIKLQKSAKIPVDSKTVFKNLCFLSQYE